MSTKEASPQQSTGLSEDIVVKLSSNLPVWKNFEVIADNIFTSMDLILKLKERSFFFLGTTRTNRLANCQVKDKKDLKKDGRRSFDHRIDISNMCCQMVWRHCCYFSIVLPWSIAHHYNCSDTGLAASPKSLYSITSA